LSTPPQEDSHHVGLDSTTSTHPFVQQLKKIRQGDSGLLPILVGLAALVIYFQIRSSVFLSAGNITNLFVQATIFILLGMAEIWLLLIGEIDLSAGFNAGVGGAIAVILVDHQFHWPWFLALGLAMVVSTLIGVINGLLVILLRLPSFIVTLAGLLGLQGVLIYMVDRQGTGGVVSVQEKVLYNLVNGNLTPLWTWIVVVVLVVLSSIVMLRSDQKRRRSGLPGKPFFITVIKIVALAVAGLLLVLVFNTNRSSFTHLSGMPFAIPIDLFVLGVGGFILAKTKAGRYLYAIGGNIEAARRAGINVNRYRLMAFGLTGLTAGIAGLLYVSRLVGISDGIEGGTYVLYAVAAAVIGGTSLFGGRGKMIHAVIGGLVIATIDNGMALIGLSAATQLIATALVLLAAVTVDSVARRASNNAR
jgi:D-xylose transport system permease protein